MPIATLPVARSYASCSVAFATSVTSTVDALTATERRDYDRLPHESRRRDWLAGRCAAKRAIASRCGTTLALDEIQLKTRAGAAPRCLVRGAHAAWTSVPLNISIAHRDGVAIAAAADDATLVGVDIERDDDIARAHYGYFMTPSEGSLLDATLVWVLKEAVWKALGLEHDVSFTDVRLDFAPASNELRGIWVPDGWVPARADVLRLTRSTNLVAAVLEIGRERQ